MNMKKSIVDRLAQNAGAINYGGKLFLHGQPSDLFINNLVSEVLTEVFNKVNEKSEALAPELIFRDLIVEELENHFNEW